MVTFIELDVRPILAAGDEPFARIMDTVAALRADEGIRLIAPFRPMTLLQVLGARGFSFQDREIGNGDWEVLFSRVSNGGSARETAAPPDDTPWPAPLMHLDNRNLEPPEPMVRILAAAEAMQPGEVMSALLNREPVFLFPQLAQRGHQWRGQLENNGATYRLLIRIGTGPVHGS